MNDTEYTAVGHTVAPFVSFDGLPFFAQLLRGVFPLEYLQAPFPTIRFPAPISENTYHRLLSLSVEYGLLQRDPVGAYQYPTLTFAQLLYRVELLFRTEWASSAPKISEELFSNDFFQAILYHVQRILNITQRRDRKQLTIAHAKIELLRILASFWFAVLEIYPAPNLLNLPLLQLYYLLRDDYKQIDLHYLIQQLEQSPYALQICQILANNVETTEANFPFLFQGFAQEIGLNPTDTSLLWDALCKLIDFLGTLDTKVKDRWSLLEGNFAHTAQWLFQSVKDDTLLFTYTSEFVRSAPDAEAETNSPLEDIASLCKEIAQQLEHQSTQKSKNRLSTLFIFLGQPGRGQRDLARILRRQLADIADFPYCQGYYEWDVLRLLEKDDEHITRIFQRYQKGCIYFYNFPLLTQQDARTRTQLRRFLSMLRVLLVDRMFIFDLISSSYLEHYLPELEDLPISIIHFQPYTVAYLQHHFRQLAVMSEVDINADIYPMLREFYEQAKPFFDKGVHADQFVYQLFAESLNNMSFRIRGDFQKRGLLMALEIIPTDLQKAFHHILHL